MPGRLLSAAPEPRYTASPAALAEEVGVGEAGQLVARDQVGLEDLHKEALRQLKEEGPWVEDSGVVDEALEMAQLQGLFHQGPGHLPLPGASRHPFGLGP
jgi:hypothetical protein